ncbi:MAG: FUSC family protein [Treponema sp.]|jgi:uncharacterized membrane protein YgaE (UPF0421/DUF939 family)|nr:FUSC family protein [Treponema sp.]
MNKKEMTRFDWHIDIKISLAMGGCLLIATAIPEFQIMTACIATLLCVQNGVKESGKSGLIRIIITAIGGLIAILVVLADNRIGNQWIFIVMIVLGVLVTLFGCKVARVPSFNARIGGVTFILVVLTKTGPDRISYALFRLLSTLYGVIVVVFVSMIFAAFSKKEAPAPENESVIQNKIEP